jgi:membrane associated rhomboid family serine protease
MRWWSATQWLIAINVAVFAIDWISGRQFTRFGAFSADAAVYHLQLWRWFTYEFLHADPFHLLFNMIALWAVGPVLESRLQRARYVVFYLICGLGAVLGYLLFWRLDILEVTRDSELLGASGCVFGVMLAAAHIAPHIRFRFYAR